MPTHFTGAPRTIVEEINSQGKEGVVLWAPNQQLTELKFETSSPAGHYPEVAHSERRQPSSSVSRRGLSTLPGDH